MTKEMAFYVLQASSFMLHALCESGDMGSSRSISLKARAAEARRRCNIMDKLVQTGDAEEATEIAFLMLSSYSFTAHVIYESGESGGLSSSTN